MRKRVVLYAMLLACALAACASNPSGDAVVTQARPGQQVSFDVVNIDDGVVHTLLNRPHPGFREHFKPYQPPPELKIAVGDVVSVVIWESADNGLFGNSLTELTFPAGAAAKARTHQLAPPEALTGIPGGLTATSPGMLQLLMGAPGTEASASEFGGAFASETERRGGRETPSLRGPEGLSSYNPVTGERQDENRGENEARGVAGIRSPATMSPGAPTEQQLLQLAEQKGRPGTRIPDQAVGPDGAISIPYGGRIDVAGRTPEEVQKKIEGLLGPRALDPQALVVVRRSFANSVSVQGEDIKGTRVSLSPGGERLLQVIAAAGGAHAPVHDVFVKLSRDGTTATVPLATLVADPAQDIYAKPGDVVTLIQRPQTYSVFGATGKNAAITFLADRMTLSEALARAGGLNDNRADPRSVFVFRYEPVSVVHALGQPVATGAPHGMSPIAYRLDLNKAKSYLLARRFLVHDKDIIFVADARLRPLYQFVQTLSNVAGPAVSGILVCHYSTC